MFPDWVQATTADYERRIQMFLTRVLCLAIATQFLFACTLLEKTGFLPQFGPFNDKASLQGQRAVSANNVLQELDEIDTLIKLDNRKLAEQIAGGLKAQAALTGSFYFSKLNVRFYKQYIALDSELDITDSNGNHVSATATGDILLDFSGNHLEWFPRFDHLQVNSADFIFEQMAYIEPNPALNQLLLQRLNSDIADVLILHDFNSIPLNAVPLGEIELGASVPGLSQSRAKSKRLLNGVFIVAGSAVLVEPSVTSIALDLRFIPELSSCPVDVAVSRAVFSKDVKDREPVGLARNMNVAEDVSYFYSEISGATRPLTIIHYWFADGEPRAVEELEVKTSERWRTWKYSSSKRNQDVSCIPSPYEHLRTVATYRGWTGPAQTVFSRHFAMISKQGLPAFP
jgi:hypothetical protein